MRIIITGGSGLIGRALSVELAIAGYEVVVLSRNPSKAKQVLPGDVQMERWDGITGEVWGKLIDEDCAVVNLAGENLSTGRWTPARKTLILESRVGAGEAVVSAIQSAEKKPKVLIQSSAVGYYGAGKDELITETHPAGDDFVSNICKRWEASTAEVEKLGVRRVIIRTGIVLDAHHGALARMILPFKFFIGGKIGNGKQFLPWVHIQDEVRAIKFFLEQEHTNGAYNICAPNPVTNAQFAHILGRVLKRPSRIPTPAIAIKILFGEMSTIVLTGQRAIPERLSQVGFKFNYQFLENALNDILL